MIHVFPRWSFGYLLQAKPKHAAAGHEVIYGTCAAPKKDSLEIENDRFKRNIP